MSSGTPSAVLVISCLTSALMSSLIMLSHIQIPVRHYVFETADPAVLSKSGSGSFPGFATSIRKAKPGGKATDYKQRKAQAAPSRSEFAGCTRRASGAHWSASITPQISDEAIPSELVQKRGRQTDLLALRRVTVFGTSPLRHDCIARRSIRPGASTRCELPAAGH